MAYSAHEVARIAGVSKNTLLRWLRQGKVSEVCRDRNGWRVFEQADVDCVRAYACRITPPAPQVRAVASPACDGAAQMREGEAA